MLLSVSRTSRTPFFPLLLLIIVVVPGACSKSPETILLSGSTMGTTFSVKLVRQKHATEVLRHAIDARLEAVNAQMSTWRADSEITRFNASPDDDWFGVSSDFQRVTERALQLGKLTDGALDITVMPLVDLWGFGPAFNGDTLPDQAAVEVALSRVRLDRIETRADGPGVRKSDPNTTIDLSAIAKGFGVDAVSEVLTELGYHNFLVEIGGEVRARGHRPDGTAWRVAVERPVTGQRTVELVIPLVDSAIATSGDYRNFFEMDGRRYSHVIDPRTGWPPDNGVASVTVVATDAMTADGLATGMMVMGSDSGMALAESEGIAVLFILRRDDRFETRMSGALRELLNDE
jgi:thiamine biosynthesis lipoprotein